MKTLTEIGLQHNTDKATYHHFTQIYEPYFNKIRDKQLNILEIGIFNGGSLRMLKEYFFTSKIYGIDFDASRCFTEERIQTKHGDQTDIAFLASVFPGIEFDVIIDDGGHTMQQQQVSLEALLPRLKTGGIYVIEDLHTSYEHDFLAPNNFTTLNLIENIKTHDAHNHNFFITDLQLIQKNISEAHVHYTNDKASITSIILKSEGV